MTSVLFEFQNRKTQLGKSVAHTREKHSSSSLERVSGARGSLCFIKHISALRMKIQAVLRGSGFPGCWEIELRDESSKKEEKREEEGRDRG